MKEEKNAANLSRNLSRSKLFLVFVFFIFFFTSRASGKILILEGVVKKVSDGDTVWIKLDNGNRVKVRVWGIDTPEKFRSKKLFRDAQKCGVPVERMIILGKDASKEAKKLLAGKKVKLVAYGRGHYGRLIARVLIEEGRGMEKDFGLEMIKKGYACVYWKSHSSQYEKALLEAEKERRGLWKEDYEVMKCLCAVGSVF